MLRASSSWSTPQLTGFLAHLSVMVNVAEALEIAAVDVAEAVDAEVAAVVMDGTVASSVGFPEGRAPVDAVLDVAAGRSGSIYVPGSGPSPAIAVPLEASPGAALVVARAGREEFTREERNLLRGMGSALTLTLRMLRLVTAERAMRAESERQAEAISGLLHSVSERQRLLQAMSTIDRAIAHRWPVDEILDSITEGVHQFLQADVAALRLVDGADTESMTVASMRGAGPDVVRRHRVSDGTSGRAYLENKLVVDEDCAARRGSPAEFGVVAGKPLATAMAAPVHEGERVVGSLAVGSCRPGRSFTEDERAQLVAFAEQASIALTDASTLAAMHQARHDPLTGLANRALFLERAAVRLSQSGAEASLVFLDLDGLKNVNDTLGHPAGDTLLVEVARRLGASIRSCDLVARLGGDEFVVLIEEAGEPGEAGRVSDRILDELRITLDSDGPDLRVSASIGVALGSAGESVEELVRRADVAMYRAKARGGDCWELWRPGLGANPDGSERRHGRTGRPGLQATTPRQRAGRRQIGVIEGAGQPKARSA